MCRKRAMRQTKKPIVHSESETSSQSESLDETTEYQGRHGKGGNNSKEGSKNTASTTHITPDQQEYYKGMSDEKLLQRADVKYDTVVYEIEKHFKPSSLIDKNGNTINNGNIDLSFADNDIVFRTGTRPQDLDTSVKSNFGETKDLVAAIKILSCTTNYPKTIDLSFTSVPKVENEGFRDNAPHVVHTIDGFHANSIYKNTVIDRTDTITSGVIVYKNVHGSFSAKDDYGINFIQREKSPSYALIPMQSPIIGVFLKKYPSIEIDKTADDIRIEIPVAKELIAQLNTIEENSVSMGNVTSGLKITISAPPTSDEVKSIIQKTTELQSAKGEDGKRLGKKEKESMLKKIQYKGFADTDHVFRAHANDKHPEGNGKTTMSEHYLKTELHFSMVIEVTYSSTNDGKTIAFKQ